VGDVGVAFGGDQFGEVFGDTAVDNFHFSASFADDVVVVVGGVSGVFVAPFIIAKITAAHEADFRECGEAPIHRDSIRAVVPDARVDFIHGEGAMFLRQEV
jgi:hypothetical protein